MLFWISIAALAVGACLTWIDEIAFKQDSVDVHVRSRTAIGWAGTALAGAGAAGIAAGLLGLA
jgi:hypothetical protein